MFSISAVIAALKTTILEVAMSEHPATVQEGGSSPKEFQNSLFEWLQAMVYALLILILAFTLFVRIINVDGSSMYPTLENGDKLILRCIDYQPRQGDIVVLTKEFASIDTPIVKRVIAVGGQAVEVNYDEGKVYVDGNALNEPYINEIMQDPQNSYMTNNEVMVPDHAVFVMGDNRNHSSDSRDVRLGVVDNRYIIGKAIFTLLPFQHVGSIT